MAELLGSLSNWIEFATLGIIVIGLAIAILKQTPSNLVEFVRSLPTGIAFNLSVAAFVLGAGFMLNLLGSWYLEPAHYYVIGAAQDPPLLKREVYSVGAPEDFFLRPLPWNRTVGRDEMRAFELDNLRQAIFEICDKDTFDADIPGVSRIKQTRLVRGLAFGSIVLFFVGLYTIGRGLLDLRSGPLALTDKHTPPGRNQRLHPPKTVLPALAWTAVAIVFYFLTLWSYWFIEFSVHGDIAGMFSSPNHIQTVEWERSESPPPDLVKQNHAPIDPIGEQHRHSDRVKHQNRSDDSLREHQLVAELCRPSWLEAVKARKRGEPDK